MLMPRFQALGFEGPRLARRRRRRRSNLGGPPGPSNGRAPAPWNEPSPPRPPKVPNPTPNPQTPPQTRSQTSKSSKPPNPRPQIVNTKVWALFHDPPIRFRPDQTPEIMSPGQVAATGFASGSGLSIFLAAAGRAVGVPARVAGARRGGGWGRGGRGLVAGARRGGGGRGPRGLRGLSRLDLWGGGAASGGGAGVGVEGCCQPMPACQPLDRPHPALPPPQTPQGRPAGSLGARGKGGAAAAGAAAGAATAAAVGMAAIGVAAAAAAGAAGAAAAARAAAATGAAAAAVVAAKKAGTAGAAAAAPQTGAASTTTTGLRSGTAAPGPLLARWSRTRGGSTGPGSSPSRQKAPSPARRATASSRRRSRRRLVRRGGPGARVRVRACVRFREDRGNPAFSAAFLAGFPSPHKPTNRFK
jgi:hypothetical protein